MEELKDKLFLVVYKDDMGSSKTKHLRFLNMDSKFMVFYNEERHKVEVLNTTNIFRMEEVVAKV